MKKLNLLFALLLLAQGAAAEKINPNYTNLAVLVAETGASWSAEEMLNNEQTSKQLNLPTAEINNRLSDMLEQRFNTLLEASTPKFEE